MREWKLMTIFLGRFSFCKEAFLGLQINQHEEFQQIIFTG